MKSEAVAAWATDIEIGVHIPRTIAAAAKRPDKRLRFITFSPIDIS
jgi:hypothetical protein